MDDPKALDTMSDEAGTASATTEVPAQQTADSTAPDAPRQTDTSSDTYYGANYPAELF